MTFATSRNLRNVNDVILLFHNGRGRLLSQARAALQTQVKNNGHEENILSRNPRLISSSGVSNVFATRPFNWYKASHVRLAAPGYAGVCGRHSEIGANTKEQVEIMALCNLVHHRVDGGIHYSRTGQPNERELETRWI